MFKLNLSAKTRLLSGVSLIAIALTTPAAATTFSGLTGQSAATVATTIATKAPVTTTSTGSVAGATAATTQSTTDLSNALATIKAQMSAQASAHSAAVSSTATSTVTDGLSTNGLVVDPRVTAGADTNLWVNVEAPTQTTSGTATTVTIKQTDTRAIATWQSFNVGKNTTVYFDQSKGTTTNGNSWVILNRVDATGSPSQILGQIKAEGTVILINPNGILFSGSSQVNTHSLIASSLDINSFGNTNYGVFNASGSYTPVTVDGVTQTTADGTVILAPAGEDSGNISFTSNGAYANSYSQYLTIDGATKIVSVPTLVLSEGSNAGSNAGVVVEKGAVISAVDNVSGFDNGGYIALVGTNVTNKGLLETSAGQIILASGSTVTISTVPTGSTATAFTVANAVPQGYSLSYTPASISGGSTTLNDADGLLLATRGNITLVGDTVDQDGVVEATTSITRPASIVITATDTTTFGADSVTAILPEDNGETIVANSLSSYTAPSISISTINLDMASGSLIEAPGATMTVSVYLTPDQAAVSTDGILPSGRVLLEKGSTIDLAGLTDVAVPLSNYLYTFKVTANDVADTPEAKSLIGTTVTINLLETGTRADGETWVGSPLFAATTAGYLGDIKESIDQLLTSAGSLTIGSTVAYKDVLTQSGSLINVSGGWVSYTGANMPTTKLLSASGIVIDIAKADYTTSYSVAGQTTETSDRWGVSTTYTNGLLSSDNYVDGYVAGTNAGSINLTAVNPVVEGSILGVTVAGANQRANAQMPTGTSLTITLKAADSNSSGDNVVLQSASTGILGDDFTLASELELPQEGIVYSTDLLTADNLYSITIKGATDLSMQKGANLTVQNGGTIKLTGVSTIDGSLTAHAGTISLTGYVPYGLYDTPSTDKLVIGADARLDVSGVWVNDTGLDNATMTGAAYINGGKVSITTNMVSGIVSMTYLSNGNYILEAEDKTQSIVLAKGSAIDLSSGGYVGTTGKLKTGSNGLPVGNGGSLSLITYAQSSKIASWGVASGVEYSWMISPQGNAAAPVSYTADVEMNGTITAGGLYKDGSFTLQVPTIVVDGKATSVTNDTSTLASDASSGEITTILPTSFFTDSGFGSFNLTSVYGGITVTSGTTLTLKQQNYILDTDTLPETGTALHTFASLGYADANARTATNLSLTQYGTYTSYAAAGSEAATAGVTLEEGASIVADPQATISLAATGAVVVLGSIVDHGGSINLTSMLDSWIGSDALLDVSGIFIEDTTQTLYETGKVLDGGTITLGGSSGAIRDGGSLALNVYGDIIVLEGAKFDLSGTSATIQVPTATLTSLTAARYVDKDIWSNGGTLTINGASGYNNRVYFAGTIDAAGGSSAASGGTLVLNGVNNIVVTQSGDVSSVFASVATPTTAAALNALTGVTLGTGSGASIAYIAADTIDTAGSGLDNVSLLTSGYSTGTNRLYFSGDVDLTVRGTLNLDGNITLLPTGVTDIAYTTTSCGTACIDSIGATDVTLKAGYIDWYTNTLNGLETVHLPTLADGTLTLNATSQIDLQNDLSVSNAANVNLISGGDIRLIGSAVYDSNSNGYKGTYGALLVADNLTLTAREIYPTTDTQFTLMSLGLDTSTSSGSHNTITIASNGKSTYTPLSAGGAIYVDAQNIVQDGALIAPLGTIKLGYNSSDSLPAFYSWCYTAAGVWCSLSTVATASVTLASGSLTQTSADGVTIPYGTTVSGKDWTQNGVDLTSGLEKLVELAGDTVTTESGATINENGGGDIYATEFVSGTGGTRDLRTLANTYALIPSYKATVAAGTSSTLTAGTAITLTTSVDGIPAGTYVLMPASYATATGAYLVTIVKTDTGSAGSSTTTTGDGSVYTTAKLTNTVTGATSSSTAFLKIQSSDVWTKYSEVDVTYGDKYFSTDIAANAGRLVAAAAKSLSLNSTNSFTAATGGAGGEVDITGTDLLVVSSDLKAALIASADYDSYIVLDADQLSGLGAESVLIGGTRTSTTAGTLITATASNVEVATDSAHALTGPEILVATKTGGEGIVVDANSVIKTSGTVSANDAGTLLIGTSSVSGDGSLLRVSNGGTVTVTRTNATAADGELSIGAGATLTGTTIDLDSSGTTTLATDANLTAKNYDLAANVINVGGGSTGLVLSDSLIAKLAGATSVDLRSASVINFYGDVALGTSASPIGTLTLDGAGLYSDGGAATVNATNIVLKDSQSTVSTANAVSGANGSLTVAVAKELTFGAGAKTLGGFSTASFTAGSDILFTGSGSLGASATNLTLTAPALIADTSSSQSLTTTGNLSIAQGTGTAPTLSAKQIGGALTFTAASISDAGTIDAQGGKVTLEATSGDVTLSGNAAIKATGTEIAIGDLTEDTPAGTVKLIADKGNVSLGSGTSIDVSAAGVGYAGTLEIEAAKTASLGGTLTGTAKYNDLGASFVLIADNYTGSLPVTGFTRAFEVELGQGDITIAKGQTLTSNTVLLVTDKGSISVDGTIDASGQSAGTIGLYGAGGVAIGSDAKLYARYLADDKNDPAYSSTANQNGGTITLGTSGTPDGTYNATYGYENVPTSGAITIASGALFDVSGGTKGTGGTIYLRAPLLSDGSVNVSIDPGAVFTGASAKTLEAYAVWSTADATTGALHFDGIVDPAGWYTATGTLEAGSFATTTSVTDSSGTTVTTNAIATWDGTTLTMPASTTTTASKVSGYDTFSVATTYSYDSNSQTLTVTVVNSSTGTTTTTYTGASSILSYLLSNSDFAVSGANTAHQTFYGYTNGTSSSGAGTLMGFVENGLTGSKAQTAATNAGFTLVPGIELDNPLTTVNGGKISVLTNWNLGAQDSVGNLLYRFNGNAPMLTLRAIGDVDVNASITDGFSESLAIGYTTTIAGNSYGSSADMDTAYGRYYWYDSYYASTVSTLEAKLTTNGISWSSSDFAITAPAVYSLLNGSYSATSSDYFYLLYYGYTNSYAQLYSKYISDLSSSSGLITTKGTKTAYMYRNLIDDYNCIANGACTYTTIGGATGTINTSTSYAAYKGYSAYTAYQQAVQYYSKINSSNSASTNLSYYQAYLDSYNTYINAWNSWAGRERTTANTYVYHYFTELPAAPLAFPSSVNASITAGTTVTATVDNSPSPTVAATNASPISSMDLASEASSTSYRIVAGADFASANPLAVSANSTADVVIEGTTSYTNTESTAYQTITVGTVVRTGTGSIAIAASRDLTLNDGAAVYTAGTATDTSTIGDLTEPTLTSSYLSNPNGLISSPSWATNGGSITIAVGGDIVGDESSSEDGTDNWASWYYHLTRGDGSSIPFSATGAEQTAAWVNYATFSNGIGALGGGNVSLTAGGDIKNLIVSLPESLLVSGGTTSADATAHYYGGGNLSVKVGGDLLSSAFLVGDGVGTIQVTGDVVASSSSISALQLGVQNGYITLIASGDVTLDGIYDPAELANQSAYANTGNVNGNYVDLPGYEVIYVGYDLGISTLGTTFSTYSKNSGVALTSIGGDVTIGDGSVSSTYSNNLTPANLLVSAYTGDIVLKESLDLIASSDGELSLIAGGTISADDGGRVFNIAMADGTFSTTVENGNYDLLIRYTDALGTANPTTLNEAVHTGDTNPVLVYAGGDISNINISVVKPAKVYAAGDIVNLWFTGMNISRNDITSIIAGGSILSRQEQSLGGVINSGYSTLQLYGPGSFLVEAGGDLGPFNAGTGGGILSLGDGSNSGSTVYSYLPVEGADIYALWGVKGGIDYAAAITAYVNPANAGSDGISYLSYIADYLGVSEDKAWVAFEGLSTTQQQLLIDKAFAAFLAQVAVDYNDSTSTYYQKYARAYQTIATLFPATFGYTANNTGESNGAASLVHTGDLNMAHSLIETQTGGDIVLLGPGGNAYVGVNSSDGLKPSQEGILTLQGGNILGYTDGSVEVYQSRIFTEQGGDIDLFSANGDLNAGKGVKSSASYPQLSLVCDVDGYCRVSPAGLVTGAGIGALLSIPGQDPSLSNAVLAAPHGTVDAGAAGIRVAGNLEIVALYVANAFNIDVGGKTIGVPVVSTNLNLATVSNASTEATTILDSLKAKEPQNTIDVEVTGFGGQSEEPDYCIPTATNKCGRK